MNWFTDAVQCAVCRLGSIYCAKLSLQVSVKSCLQAQLNDYLHDRDVHSRPVTRYAQFVFEQLLHALFHALGSNFSFLPAVYLQAKGGSFGLGAERELYKFQLGAHTAIPAIEEAIISMKPGGIRRLIVPVEIGYPDNDFNKKGPKPSTFSVRLLHNGMITLRWN